MMTRVLPAAGLLAVTLACDPAARTRAAAQPDERRCTVAAARALPSELFETSGLARGVRDTLVFWTHNDGRAARLHALDGAGAVIGAARIEGLELEDWEDLESARCGTEPCLLIADIGDNDARRQSVALHEVREPAPGGTSAGLRTQRLRYPEGPRDAEALFALPDGRRFIVTKGRHDAITLYQVPEGPADTAVTLQTVRELAPRPRHERDRVTAATASPDGRWVAIRTYRTLLLFAADSLERGAATAEYDLRAAQELQGEGLAIDGGGSVWLTSEAEQREHAPRWTRLACPLPADAARPRPDSADARR